MEEVTITAASVPSGMECCASRKSPERLEPAMMPVTDGKKRARDFLKLKGFICSSSGVKTGSPLSSISARHCARPSRSCQ